MTLSRSVQNRYGSFEGFDDSSSFRAAGWPVRTDAGQCLKNRWHFVGCILEIMNVRRLKMGDRHACYWVLLMMYTVCVYTIVAINWCFCCCLRKAGLKNRFAIVNKTESPLGTDSFHIGFCTRYTYTALLLQGQPESRFSDVQICLMGIAVFMITVVAYQITLLTYERLGDELLYSVLLIVESVLLVVDRTA